MNAGRLVTTAGALLLAAASQVAHPAGPAAAPAPAAERLIHDYNARDIGAPGWRRVSLNLETGGRVTRRFSILHLFGRQGTEIRSLVVLEAPPGLRGTDYLLIEGTHDPAGMKLFLHLPAGEERVLSILPSRFEEGLLGSDFTYSDLRWLIPTDGWRFRLAGSTTLLGRTVRVIEAEPVRAEVRESTVWAVVRYYLATAPDLLLGADFYRQPNASPAKRLRVEAVERRGRVWTPTRMVMAVSASRSSVLTLGETGFGEGPARPELFVPAALARNAARLLAEGFGKR